MKKDCSVGMENEYYCNISMLIEEAYSPEEAAVLFYNKLKQCIETKNFPCIKLVRARDEALYEIDLGELSPELVYSLETGLLQTEAKVIGPE